MIRIEFLRFSGQSSTVEIQEYKQLRGNRGDLSKLRTMKALGMSLKRIKITLNNGTGMLVTKLKKFG